MPRQTKSSLTSEQKSSAVEAVKYHRARVRHFLFTHGPHRLTKGRSTRKHISREIVAREITITNPRWPRELDGLRIAHLSDFHLGELMPLDRALAAVDLAANFNPDIVACTGDVVDLHYEGSQPLFDAMADIDAPFGSAMVLGNHDELEDGKAVARLARNAGMRVLHNESLEITRNNRKLIVAGVGWGKTLAVNSQNVEATCDQSTHLLLAHNPKAFRKAAAMNVPLTLAGHTHGGQVAMKKRSRINLAVTNRHTAGLYEHRACHLFVTTGVGSWFPLRVNCPPEIAILTVQRGKVKRS